MTTNGKSTSAPNTAAGAPTGVRPDVATRFKPGNTAAKRHGLRAGTRKELRRRDDRTSRLLGKYLAYRAEQSRPLTATQLPLARRYVEAECMARDLYALLMSTRPGSGTLSRYISVVRVQGMLAGLLGEGVSKAKYGKVDSLQNSALWQIAEASRQRRQLEASR
ncbi:MAG TPA: hypothetical protein VGS16_13685 [Candidatus Dormibacteraeota bacterium]|nr:hypothetical protein [Candidatus Dormibacteraeota bacterium]